MGSENVPERVNKREFLARVARRAGVPATEVSNVYRALVEELIDTVLRDQVVVLTGLGNFSRQMHKGHKVRFGQDRINAYSVLKFSASQRMNRKLDALVAEREEVSI